MSISVTSTISRNKKKIVDEWLRLLMDTQQVDYPFHRMTRLEWFALFERHHEHYDPAIFSDIRFFSLQMNNIVDSFSINYLRKEVTYMPEHIIFYILDSEVYDNASGDHGKLHIINYYFVFKIEINTHFYFMYLRIPF